MSQVNPDPEFTGPAHLSELDRRHFLKYMGLFSSMSLLSACSREAEKLVPFPREIEEFSQRNFEYYTTGFNSQGFAQGLLAKSFKGRPIKIEGNPKHGFSNGATTPQAQATLYDLYHPDRIRGFKWKGKSIDQTKFYQELENLKKNWNKGEGVAFLFPPDHSPTTNDLIKKIQAKYPASMWSSIAPWKKEQWTTYELSKIQTIAVFDEDIFYQRPDALKLSGDFMRKRLRAIETQSRGDLNRLIVLQSSPTLVGAKADETLILPPHEIWNNAIDLLSLFEGKKVQNTAMEKLHSKLKSSKTGIVILNRNLHSSAGELEHKINSFLQGNAILTYDFPLPETHSDQDLIKEIERGKIHTLFMWDSDPVYWDNRWEKTLGKVPLKINLALFPDETHKICEVQVAKSHFLESWSDLQDVRGDVIIQQPLIQPLFSSLSPLSLLSSLLEKPQGSYEIVQNTWQSEWEKALQTGVMTKNLKSISPTREKSYVRYPPSDGWKIKIVPDPTIDYGQYSDNPVLQELPKHFSTLTWQNAFYLSRTDADSLSLQNGDVIEVNKIQGPVWILPNIAPKLLVATLGYGKKSGSFIGKKRGFNAYPFQNFQDVSVRKTFKTRKLASTQPSQNISLAAPVKVASFLKPHDQKKEKVKSLYPDHPLPHQEKGPQWGMTIDLTSCIGCQACVSSCQVENNVPFVGEDQVLKSRILHWLRVDTYFEEVKDGSARSYFQPVPCMHCEKAPCEVVCPVNATLHGNGGLNEMVYNRCVGTRYCSNNCPYKVRRFNFRAYSSLKASWDLGFNPDVSVRNRGVMEKCTFCIQRIKESEKTGSEVVTACQSVCPTKAIQFGNIKDHNSKVSLNKKSFRNYDLLEEEGTRPRTSYLKEIRNEEPGS